MFRKICRFTFLSFLVLWVMLALNLVAGGFTTAGASLPAPPSIKEVCGTYSVTFTNKKRKISVKGQLTFTQKADKLVIHTKGEALKAEKELQFLDGLVAEFIVDRVLGDDPSNIGNNIHFNVRQAAGSKGTFWGVADYSAVRKDVVINNVDKAWTVKGEKLSSLPAEDVRGNEKEAIEKNKKENRNKGRDKDADNRAKNASGNGPVPSPEKESEAPADALSDEAYDHNNLPETEEGMMGAAAATALGGAVLGLGGALAGASAGAGAGGIPGGSGGAAGNFGPHLSRDADGDLHIMDSTGRERVYVNQGDGTYREVGGFGSVTQRDLEEEAARLQEHAGYYQQIERQRQTAVEEQRKQARELSETSRRLLAEEEQAKADAQKEEYMAKLRQKYGVYDDDRALREEIQAKINWNAERARKQTQIANGMDMALKAAETTQVAADIGVSVLATATGQVGIQNAYIAAKNMAGSLSDAVANDKNIGTAVAQGALNTVADLTVSKLEGAGWHVTGNAAGAGFKKMVANACEGNPLLEGVGTSAAFGGAAGLVSKGISALGEASGKGISQQANNYVHGGMTGMRHLDTRHCTEAGYRAVENIRLTALLEGVRGLHTLNNAGAGLVEGSKWALGQIEESI